MQDETAEKSTSKTNIEEVQKEINASGCSVPANPTQASSVNILSLDIDCFEAIFDYLTLQDLISISKTCKHHQQSAGFILHRNYSAAVVQCKSSGISVGYYFDGDDLTKFIHKVIIIGNISLAHFHNIRSKFHQLKEIDLFSVDLNVNWECYKELLCKLQSLRIKHHVIKNLYENIPIFCTNLKRLCVARDANDLKLNEGETDWLLQKYPALEHFELSIHTDRPIDELNTFLELNMNIRKFATTAECLWQNQHLISCCNAKLEELAIWFGHDEKVELIPICGLLNKLHERGFYQRLLLYYFPNEFDQHAADQWASVNSLTKLYAEYAAENIDLSVLKSLKEIFCRTSETISDLNALIINCAHLKRIHFLNSSFNDIFVLISKAVRLEKIKVDFLSDGTDFSTVDNVIDLVALNNARRKLDGARKVTLYVREGIYVATKWAINRTDMDFIRLKREQSYEWYHDFSCFN